MPDPSETLVDLEQHLAARLLALERLDEAWPRRSTAFTVLKVDRSQKI